jgi:predicted pyridoxine 5'-phosphate oxidase superfamily flavin-nucleotide-binding protein
MQREAGVVEKMAAIGRRSVRHHLIEQHRLFYPQLPFAVLGSVDGNGDIWATIRSGHPGFLSSPDDHHLNVSLQPDPDDPAEAGMADGAGIGLLGIELHTRRRNRLNGIVHRMCNGFSIEAVQSYGNCAQYIQLRQFSFARDPGRGAPVPPVARDHLSSEDMDLIRKADTFFVASAVADGLGRYQVDVSHRGGKPGFVRLDPDDTLTIPDFPGNRFFNTLGNFILNPKAGLAFVDFETGNLLQMTGDVEIDTKSENISTFEGAQRLWRFHPRQVVSRPEALPIRWQTIPSIPQPD